MTSKEQGILGQDILYLSDLLAGVIGAGAEYLAGGHKQMWKPFVEYGGISLVSKLVTSQTINEKGFKDPYYNQYVLATVGGMVLGASSVEKSIKTGAIALVSTGLGDIVENLIYRGTA